MEWNFGMEFKPELEVERLAKLQETRRKKRLFVSKIDKFEHQILALQRAGASLSQLQIWLKENGIKASRSTISRWLNGKV